jgi:8-oxo-dGTP pyrophosphatase MutT (NUDIX family)
MTYSFDAEQRQRLRQNLARFERRAIDREGLRVAAVCLVVTRHSEREEACILLTRRPEGLRRHAGQFALPGGRVDEGETLKDAALRELQEELGVTVGDDAIIGCLDDYPTRSGFSITPFVVWGDAPLKITPDPEEVARVFHIPFSELDSPRIPFLEEQEAHEHPVLSAPLATVGDRVFAPTAAMLYQFREVAMNGRETRVAHFDQPAFAWK